MSYKFDQPDWFSHNTPHWINLKDLMSKRKSFLEIGSFEGRSTVWIAENLADRNATIHCLDTWQGGEEHQDSFDMDQVRKNFEHNIQFAEARTHVDILSWKNESSFTLQQDVDFLSYVPLDGFDFIYIDGSHQAADVLTDACLSWNLLQSGGVMVFDDYQWHPSGFKDYQTPKPAIDAFLSCFEGRYNPIWSGYQVAIQKV